MNYPYYLLNNSHCYDLVVTHTQEHCYLSTPAHLQTIYGRFICSHNAKGSLLLTRSSLIFCGNQSYYDIPLCSITDIRQGKYPWVSYPVRLHYIILSFINSYGRKQTVFLTPSVSWKASTKTCNLTVGKWLGLLQNALNKRSDVVDSQSAPRASFGDDVHSRVTF